jgi:pimeloyl-ACP methyl ester carboxylesterase
MSTSPGFTLTRTLAPVALAAALASGCGALAFHPTTPPGAPQGATFATVGGVRLRTRALGDASGTPVLFLHGFASSLETWDAVQPLVAKSRRTLAVDLKGFGYSARPAGDYSPPAQAKMLLELLDQQGIHEVIVVAHSWGTSIALAMALEAPQRVKRLALYDAWAYEEQLPPFFLWARTPNVGEFLFRAFYKERPYERIAFAFYDRERYVTEPLLDLTEAALERPGTVAAALEATRGQTYDEWQSRYRSISAPTLLLWGRDDEVTTLAFGERLARELPNARLAVYPRCGHFPMIEAIGASNRDLAAFLAEAP